MKTRASGKRWALCVGGVIMMWVGQEVAGEEGIFLIIMGVIAVLWGSYTWTKEKGRSGWWGLLGLTAPIGFLGLMVLSDKSRTTDKNELQECLACFEAETKVIAFQTKEADLYNNAMVKYGNSIMENPLAAREACKAAKRLSQAATEVLRRHEQIRNVPVAASAMHHAWYVTFHANAAWASATAKAIEAMAEGMNPHTIYVQQLVEEYQKAQRRAEDEDKKFLKRLKVSAEDIAKIVARATTIDVADDDWQPKETEET